MHFEVLRQTHFYKLVFQKYGKIENKVIYFENKDMYMRKYGFSQRNKDLFSYAKNKEVYIKNRVIYIQLWPLAIVRLLNKPYVNEVTLRGQKSPLRYC